MKKIIALDIDGTLTDSFHSVPLQVVEYLSKLVKEGWELIFITGRSYQWGFSVLASMEFSYYLAVQNGAIVLKMPEKTIVRTRYLDKSIFPLMDEVCREEPTDYILYAGLEHGDVCYYRPERFSAEFLQYIENRVAALGETYVPTADFSALTIEEFPSVKCFGKRESAHRMAKKIESLLQLHVTPVADPYDNNYFVVQATRPEANKGQALKEFKNRFTEPTIVIAAGNDYNDVSMLAYSDIKVVMRHSPFELLSLADVIAPSVQENGIILGLQQAISRYGL